MSDDYRQTLYRKIINATRRDFNNGNGRSRRMIVVVIII